MTRDKTRLVPWPPPLRHVETHSHNVALDRKLGGTFIATAFLIASGCAGSQPPSTQLMADVQSANRSAHELGAQNSPQAKLHLKLAEEQLKQAKVALEDDDTEGAEALLMRAKADAELAVALARESSGSTDADRAMEPSASGPRTTIPRGATP